MVNLTLSEAVEKIPPVNGRNVHPATVWRWATSGVRGVRLRSRLVGGRRVTTEADIEAFLNALGETAGV